jgi:HicB family
MTADEAKAWMLKGDVEVIHDRFAEGVPEAEPETEQGATIYLRVPTTLKRRVDQAANAASLSSNSWVMRCLENCLDNEAAALDRDADAVAVAAAAHKAKILARKTQRQAAAQAPVNEDKSKGSQANPGAGKP